MVKIALHLVVLLGHIIQVSTRLKIFSTHLSGFLLPLFLIFFFFFFLFFLFFHFSVPFFDFLPLLSSLSSFFFLFSSSSLLFVSSSFPLHNSLLFFFLLPILFLFSSSSSSSLLFLFSSSFTNLFSPFLSKSLILFTGIWLDGLTGLSIALNNATYSNFAYTLAKNAALFFANGNEDGILREVSCGGIPLGNCTGADGREFKGVFVRHLAYAILDWSTSGTSASNKEAATWGRQWISKHLDSLLQNDASVLTKEGTIIFGQFFQGPYQEDDTMWISHSAGNDIVLATLQVMIAVDIDEKS